MCAGHRGRTCSSGDTFTVPSEPIADSATKAVSNVVSGPISLRMALAVSNLAFDPGIIASVPRLSTSCCPPSASTTQWLAGAFCTRSSTLLWSRRSAVERPSNVGIRRTVTIGVARLGAVVWVASVTAPARPSATPTPTPTSPMTIVAISGNEERIVERRSAWFALGGCALGGCASGGCGGVGTAPYVSDQRRDFDRPLSTEDRSSSDTGCWRSQVVCGVGGVGSGAAWLDVVRRCSFGLLSGFGHVRVFAVTGCC